MSSIQRVCAISIFLGLFGAVTACGSDDNNGGGGTDACKQVCDKQAAAQCPNPFGLSTDDCKQFCDVLAQSSTACRDALKTQSDCQLKLSDVCSDTGCQTQEDAVGQACN